MQVTRYSVGPLDNNTYLVVDEPTREGILVDPSFESSALWPRIESEGWKITAVVNTHAHIDHVVENGFWVKRTGAPLLLHEGDVRLLRSMAEQAAWFGIETPMSVEPDRLLSDGELIEFGQSALTVAHTPGHSPGGICLLGDGFAIVGDVLFAGSIGRTDLTGGDTDQLLCAIREKLLVLPDDTIVYPGHGPETTIGRERATNPYL